MERYHLIETREKERGGRWLPGDRRPSGVFITIDNVLQIVYHELNLIIECEKKRGRYMSKKREERDVGLFGQAMIAYRKDADVTQVELSERAHLSRSYLTELETGAKKHPSKDTVFKLITAMELPREKVLWYFDDLAQDNGELLWDVQYKIAESSLIRTVIRRAIALKKDNGFWAQQLITLYSGKEA
jgi:transcriptional regulator with XRE-family HTH domain